MKLTRIRATTNLDAMERMIVMTIHHTITTTQHTLCKAIITLVFAIIIPTKDTEIVVSKEVTMPIVTK
jgi:hypothetical protein